jgi:peptidoglycan/LPS O-acetylase OafA/YrhL
LLLVAVLSALHLAGFDDYMIDREGQSLPRAMVAALGLHLNWYEGHTGYLPGGWDVLWSLSIEEVFYLAFPIVCLLTRRACMLAIMLVMLALSLPFTHAALVDNEIWQEKAYLPGMSAIAVGVLGALIAWHVGRPRRWMTIALCIVGIIGIASVMVMGREVWSLVHDAYLLILVISAMCLLLAMHWREAAHEPRKLPGTGWLQSFGRLSYEIYLTHMFVVFALVRVYKVAASDSGLGYAWYVPIVLLCWLLGWLVARFISIPADRVLRARLMNPPPLNHGERASTN